MSSSALMLWMHHVCQCQVYCESFWEFSRSRNWKKQHGHMVTYWVSYPIEDHEACVKPNVSMVDGPGMASDVILFLVQNYLRASTCQTPLPPLPPSSWILSLVEILSANLRFSCTAEQEESAKHSLDSTFKYVVEHVEIQRNLSSMKEGASLFFNNDLDLGKLSPVLYWYRFFRSWPPEWKENCWITPETDNSLFLYPQYDWFRNVLARDEHIKNHENLKKCQEICERLTKGG